MLWLKRGLQTSAWCVASPAVPWADINSQPQSSCPPSSALAMEILPKHQFSKMTSHYSELVLIVSCYLPSWGRRSAHDSLRHSNNLSGHDLCFPPAAREPSCHLFSRRQSYRGMVSMLEVWLGAKGDVLGALNTRDAFWMSM